MHYQGREITAMASGSDGRFVSQGLEPGTYTFSVEAEGFKPGECSVVVAAEPAPLAASQTTTQSEGSTQAPATPVGKPSPSGTQQPPAPPASYFGVDCELEALPRTGTVVGRVLDAETGGPVAAATVELRDPLGRSLPLTTDGAGAFRFEQVMAGAVTLKAEAPAYLFPPASGDAAGAREAHAEVALHKRPKASLVEVTPTEIRIKQQVHFGHDSAEIEGDSNALLEEVADALARTPAITRLEIQGHTDDSGPADHNKSLVRGARQRRARMAHWPRHRAHAARRARLRTRKANLAQRDAARQSAQSPRPVHHRRTRIEAVRVF